MNTCILYLYRDACNYKVYNEVIINGVLSPGQINLILDCLMMVNTLFQVRWDYQNKDLGALQKMITAGLN